MSDSIQRLARMNFEQICRATLPPEEAEKKITEHNQQMRETRIKMRNVGVNRRKYQQRYTQIIPKPAYNAARAWVRKSAATLLQEDMERAKKPGFLAQVPTEFRGWGLEKWVDRGMVDQFLCDMARQGILDPHPLGGWMAKRPVIKSITGRVIEPTLQLTFTPGVPCSPECEGHVTHPCEKCGQQWGKEPPMNHMETLNERGE